MPAYLFIYTLDRERYRRLVQQVYQERGLQLTETNAFISFKLGSYLFLSHRPYQSRNHGY